MSYNQVGRLWGLIYTEGTLLDALNRAISLNPNRILFDIDGTLFEPGTETPLADMETIIGMLEEWSKGRNVDYGFLTGRSNEQEFRTKAALKRMGFSVGVYEGASEGRKQESKLIKQKTVLIDDHIVGNLGPFVEDNSNRLQVAGIKVGFGPEVMNPILLGDLKEETMAPGSRFMMEDGTDFVREMTKRRTAPVASPAKAPEPTIDYAALSVEEAADVADLSQAIDQRESLFVDVESMSSQTLEDYVRIVRLVDPDIVDRGNVVVDGVIKLYDRSGKIKYILTTRTRTKSTGEIVIKVKLAPKPEPVVVRRQMPVRGGVIPRRAEAGPAGDSPVSRVQAEAPSQVRGEADCADLEMRLKEIEKRLALSEAYEIAQARLLQQQFIEFGKPFTNIRGKQVKLESLWDLVGTRQYPEGPNGDGAFVRASTMRKIEEQDRDR